MRSLRKKLALYFTVCAVTLCCVGLGQVFADTPLYKGAPAKYVFFFIGDGMAMHSEKPKDAPPMPVATTSP